MTLMKKPPVRVAFFNFTDSKKEYHLTTQITSLHKMTCLLSDIVGSLRVPVSSGVYTVPDDNKK